MKHIYICGILLYIATMICSCGSKSKSNENSGNSADSEAIREDALKDSLGRGELGLFDLRGPVKTCLWKNRKGNETEYTFDGKGFWIAKDGKSLSEVFSKIERDEEGRIMLGEEDGQVALSCKYNGEGLVIMQIGTDFESHYFYTADGYMSAEECDEHTIGGGGRDLVNHISLGYTMTKKDEYGNWTARVTGGYGVESREIKYY